MSLRKLFRMALPGLVEGPAYCLNCGGIDFEVDEVWGRRYECQECNWEHAGTFGGCWRADAPDGSDSKLKC